MFVSLLENEILELQEKGQVMQFALWDSVENAEKYYETETGLFTAFTQTKPTHALATPVKVFCISK